MSVRIAVDGRGLTDPFESGVRVYIRSMLQELMKTPNVEVDLFYQGKKRCPWIHDWFPQARFFKRSNSFFHLRSLVSTPDLNPRDFPEPPDLIWLPDRRPFYQTKIPVVLTVHDLVPERFFRTLSWKSRLWHALFPLKNLLKCVDALLFPSLSVAREFVEFHPHSLPFQVSYEGPCLSRNSSMPRHHLSSDFFFFLGPNDPRKGIALFLEMATCFPEISFVWAGFKKGDDRFASSSLALPSNVLILNEVSEPEKRWLFEHCKAFLAFSQYEGFDLPVLEAVQSQKSVVISDIPVHRELYESDFFFRTELECKRHLQSILDGKISIPKTKHPMSWKDSAERSLLLFRSVIFHKNGDGRGDRNGNDHP